MTSAKGLLGKPFPSEARPDPSSTSGELPPKIRRSGGCPGSLPAPPSSKNHPIHPRSPRTPQTLPVRLPDTEEQPQHRANGTPSTPPCTNPRFLPIPEKEVAPHLPHLTHLNRKEAFSAPLFPSFRRILVNRSVSRSSRNRGPSPCKSALHYHPPPPLPRATPHARTPEPALSSVPRRCWFSPAPGIWWGTLRFPVDIGW